MQAVAYMLYMGRYDAMHWHSWSQVSLSEKRQLVAKVRKIMRTEPEAWQGLIWAARGRGCNA